MGIFSLLASAYFMRFFPLHPDRKGKKPMLAEDDRWALFHAALLPLNGVVCGSLALYGFLGTRSSEPWSVLYFIPGGRSYHKNPGSFMHHPNLTTPLYSYAWSNLARSTGNALSGPFWTQGPPVRVQRRLEIGSPDAASRRMECYQMVIIMVQRFAVSLGQGE